MDILNEVYIGETDNIKKIQYYLSQWKQNILSDLDTGSNRAKKRTSYNDTWKKKFTKCVEDTFGFKKYLLTIEDSKDTNAYTVSIGHKIVDKSKLDTLLDKTSDGIKFNKSAKIVCKTIITIPLIQKTTDRELLAVLLHEIGHNFQEVLSEKSMNIATISDIVYNLNSFQNFIFSLLSLGFVVDAFSKDIFDKESLARIDDKLVNVETEKTEKSFKPLTIFIKEALNGLSLYLILKNFLKFNAFNFIRKANPLNILNNSLGYNNEKIADSFATIYGYGADLGTAIAKITYQGDKSDSKEYLFATLNRIVVIPISILVYPIDPHPDTISRMKTQISYLEKELMEGVDDKDDRKEIQSQINKLNKEIDDCMSLTKYKLNDENTNKFTILYSYALHKVFKFDIREFLSKYNDNHEDIEKTLRGKK